MLQMFSRTWRPKEIVLYFVEAIYTITDPPMKFVGRFVPPLRLGAVSLDMSFIVLFFGTQLLMGFGTRSCNYCLTSTTSTPISVSVNRQSSITCH